MELVNLSTEPEGRLRDWLPRSLHAEKVVFLPDACPGRSPLPTGCAVHTRQSDWRQFALSDCGCGMRLLRSDLGVDALKRDAWDAVADRLRANKGRLGDLGGGNHFLDALEPYDGEQLYFLIHTGSRSESGLVDDLVDDPVAFDAQFADIVAWAADNRASVQRALEATFGTMEVVVDLPHNTFERLPDGSVIIRKGAAPRGLCSNWGPMDSNMKHNRKQQICELCWSSVRGFQPILTNKMVFEMLRYEKVMFKICSHMFPVFLKYFHIKK